MKLRNYGGGDDDGKKMKRSGWDGGYWNPLLLMTVKIIQIRKKIGEMKKI